jgi:hypothetical protein
MFLSLLVNLTVPVKELFGDIWQDYGNDLRVIIGQRLRALVKQQRLPLVHEGKNGSNAHLYYIVKPIRGKS